MCYSPQVLPSLSDTWNLTLVDTRHLQVMCSPKYLSMTHAFTTQLKADSSRGRNAECTGKGSAEPASRWKRLLAGALLIGSVAAAGAACNR